MNNKPYKVQGTFTPGMRFPAKQHYPWDVYLIKVLPSESDSRYYNAGREWAVLEIHTDGEVDHHILFDRDLDGWYEG